MRFLAPIISITLLSCVVHSSSAVTFKDKQGNMSLDHLTSWHMKKMGEKEFQINGKGHPFKAKWVQQNLELQANFLEGVVRSGAKQRLELSKATIKGNVLANFVSITKAHSDTARKIHLESEELQYDQKDLKLILPSSFTLNSFYPSESQKLSLSGKKATLYLNESSNELKSGQIQGPVQIKIETLASSITKKESKSMAFFEATTDFIEISDRGQLITMQGNVRIQGEQDTFAGEITAEKATVRFNQNREIVEVDLSGNPGKTTLIHHSVQRSQNAD